MVLLEQNFTEKELDDNDLLEAIEKTRGLPQKRTVAKAILEGQNLAKEFGGRFIIEEKDGEIFFSVAKKFE